MIDLVIAFFKYGLSLFLVEVLHYHNILAGICDVATLLVPHEVIFN